MAGQIGISFPDTLNIGLVSSIHFIDQQTGWAAGGYVMGKGPAIAKTSDGGVNWQVVWAGSRFLADIQVWDNQTGWAVGQEEIIVYGAVPPAQADFTWSAQDDSVQFTNTSTDAATFFWDFGDGSSSEEENPQHIYPAPGDYVVKLTAVNACGEESVYEETLFITTPVYEQELLDAFTIYPNPAYDFFNIRIEGQAYNALVIELFSITGQKVLSETLDFQSGTSFKTISCSNLPKGLYLVRVADARRSSSRKIILQ
ncbi:MAG: PKD domain-containing protein [Saprospiraceae bacterium]|nr:PKD domain-containing protein [Saprospiraceae bacterium]